MIWCFNESKLDEVLATVAAQPEHSSFDAEFVKEILKSDHAKKLRVLQADGSELE